VGGVLGQLEGDGDVGLGAQVVDLVGLDGAAERERERGGRGKRGERRKNR
jgi:hypothetical protein